MDPISKLQDYLKPLEFDSPVINAEISDSGIYLFGWLGNDHIFVKNLKSEEVYGFEAIGEPHQIKLSDKDSNLVIIYKDNTGSVCDINGNIQYSFKTTLNEVMNDKLVSFFPSGNYHFIAAKDSNALIFDKSGGIIAELKGHKSRINSIDISPDGRFVVTASNDGIAYIWNFNNVTRQFSIYHTLVGHKDIVWSCRFNKTGKYIITASADSTIKIWNLNGKQINPQFNYIRYYRYRFNNGEYDKDRYDPKYSKYYGKFCDAKLSHDEKEIIATGYSINADSGIGAKAIYCQVLFNDAGSRFLQAYGRSYFFNDMGADTAMSVGFRHLSISPDEKVAVALEGESDKIYVLTGDGRILLTLAGTRALFSAYGHKLFWCNGKKINQIPVLPQEIKNLLIRFKIPDISKVKEEKFLEL